MNRFYTCKISGLIVLCFAVCSQWGFTQSPCSPETPYHFVDMTGDPDSLYISPLESRQGLCCDAQPPDVCVQFTVILDAGAQGLNFEIVQGAEPSGSLFYQIDCGDPIMVGQEICLEGGNEYTLTFCKPGNNPNAYSIQSIPALLVPDTVTTRVGCPAEITLEGNVVESSITWTDVTSPDSSYNSLLSCTQGCTSTWVTPESDNPAFIKYLVCGEVISSLCANTVIEVCDTTIVEVIPDFEVISEPDQLIFCENEPLDLSAYATIQDPNLLFFWYDSLAMNGAPLDTGQVFSPGASGTYSVVVVDTAYSDCAVDTAFSAVEIIPTPDLGISDSIAICEGEFYELSLPPELNYNWIPQQYVSPGADPGTFILSPVADIDFTIVAWDENGCTTSQLLPVDIRTKPTAEAGGSATLNCNFTSLMLNGGASSAGSEITYQWTGPPGGIVNGAQSISPTIGLSGWYYLEVHNGAEGCIDLDSVFIDDDFTAPELELPSDMELDCQTLNLEINAVAFAGPNLSFSWDSPNGNILAGGTGPAVIVNAPGAYILTLTDTENGCVVMDTVMVDSPDFPQFTLPSSEILCTGSSTTVYLEPGYTYFWSPSANVSQGNTPSTFTITPQNSTIYTVVAVDSEGCSSSQEMDIELESLPPAEAGDPVEFDCVNSTAVLGAADPGGQDLFMNWTGPPGSIISGGNGLTPIVIMPGWYYFNVLDLQTGCTAVDSVQVLEDQEAPQAILPDELVLDCNEAFIEINGSNSTGGLGVTYTWDSQNGNIIGGFGTQIASVDAGGVYTLTVTNQQNGCTDLDSCVVTALPPIDGANLTSVGTCDDTEDGYILIEEVNGGTPPFMVSLDNGPYLNVNSFTGLAPGVYQLTVQDANGCEWSAQPEVVPFTPINPTLGVDQEIYPGLSVQLQVQTNIPVSEIASISWTPTYALSCTDCLDPFASPPQNTTYEVEVTDFNGCSASASVNILLKESDLIYVPNIFSPNGDGNNEIFFIGAGPLVEEVELFRIFDRWGEKVYEGANFPPNDPTLGWDGSLNGKDMDPAVFVYYVQFRLLNGERLFEEGDVTLVR